MAVKPTYEELERRVKEIEQEVLENRRLKEESESIKDYLHTILNSSPIGVGISRVDGKILFSNKRIAEMRGRPESEIVGSSSINAWVDPEQRQKLVAIFEEKGRVSNKEIQLKRPDGSTYWCLTTWERIRYGGEKCILYWNFDISAIKQAEAALLKNRDELEIKVKRRTQELQQEIKERVEAENDLRVSEKKYRTILEGIEEGYYEVDLAGNFTFANAPFCRMTGVSEHELIGLNYEKFTDTSAAKIIYAAFNDVSTTQKPVKGLYWDLIRKDGIIRNTELSISLITDLAGHLKGFRGVIRDITERKALEEHLREAHKRDAIATLAGGIAHEFNNALMSVVGNIQLLEMDAAENEDIKEYLEQMKLSSNRMARLTRQLLAYARGGKYQVQTVIISNFVEDTLSILKSSIESSIRVETEIPGEIFDIYADPTQLQMVFSAVLTNASDAIENKGRIRIVTGNREVDAAFARSHPGLNPGSHVCLKFVDDGRGMDKETVGRIFDPFFSTKFQGRGLGMAAVYGIIRNHSGWIGVESEADKGTSVTIYLPAAEDKEEKSKEKLKTPKKTTDIAGTILVIEDEEGVMNVIRSILERLGHRVLEAKTGNEAAEIAKTFDGDIDLALLDIKLPDISGDRLYPIIMEVRPDLKVIVCSGYSIDGPAQKILDAGAQDFIQKPFSVTAMADKLKKVLGPEESNEE